MRPWLIAALLIASAGVTTHAADEIVLFNGKDFTGWTFYLEEKDYNAGGKGKISNFASVKPGGVIQIDPKLSAAYSTRAFAQIQLKAYKQAIADCTAALRLDPKLSGEYNTRALAHAQSKAYNEAIADCTAALQLDRDSARRNSSPAAAPPARPPITAKKLPNRIAITTLMARLMSSWLRIVGDDHTEIR